MFAKLCVFPAIYLTMTGFSDPATKPNPSSSCLLRTTERGSGCCCCCCCCCEAAEEELEGEGEWSARAGPPGHLRGSS